MPIVVRNEAASRFETVVDGWLCVADYRIEEGRIVLTSVRVPPAVEGRGIAGALTRAALDWASEQGMDVLPLCPYVQAWLRRHPDYRRHA